MKCCISNPYKSNLCRKCWREYKESLYHCTWPNCIRPVFALTLCRNHYRQINVECAWPLCHRPSYCKQVCAHHYRKKEFPPKIECSQTDCTRPMYMHDKCFYHFTCRKCTECNKTVFSKQLCQRHCKIIKKNKGELYFGKYTDPLPLKPIWNQDKKCPLGKSLNWYCSK